MWKFNEHVGVDSIHWEQFYVAITPKKTDITNDIVHSMFLLIFATRCNIWYTHSNSNKNNNTKKKAHLPLCG